MSSVRLRLKLDKESRPLMSLGRLLQRFGAAKENTLAPSVVSILPCGTSGLKYCWFSPDSIT